MAEFQEVAKHWKRMCEVYWTPNSCKGCPLAEHEQAYEACSAASIDIAKMEELVMAWAAENPEPVYPTWGEWLLEQGVIKAGTETIGGFTYQCVYDKLFNSISADIAEKLELKPKEAR